MDGFYSSKITWCNLCVSDLTFLSTSLVISGKIPLSMFECNC